jgi:hypothetical protein
LSRFLPDRLAGQQPVVLRQLAVEVADQLADRRVGAGRQVLGDAAGPDVPVVHPQAGDQLEHVEDLLALAEAHGHRGQRAELHAARGEADDVRGDAVELHEDHADRLGRCGASMPSSFSTDMQ